LRIKKKKRKEKKIRARGKRRTRNEIQSIPLAKNFVCSASVEREGVLDIAQLRGAVKRCHRKNRQKSKKKAQRRNKEREREREKERERESDTSGVSASNPKRSAVSEDRRASRRERDLSVMYIDTNIWYDSRVTNGRINSQRYFQSSIAGALSLSLSLSISISTSSSRRAEFFLIGEAGSCSVESRTNATRTPAELSCVQCRRGFT